MFFPKCMTHLPVVLLVFFLACLPCPSFSDQLESYSPPIWESFLQLDARTTESTPVNTHITFIPRPNRGDIIPIQIFLNRAAEQKAFGYIFECDDLSRSYFHIKNARTWLRYPVYGTQGKITEFIRIEKAINSPVGSPKYGRGIFFPVPPTIPPDGLIAEISLEAQQDVPPSFSVSIHIYAAILSNTQPERIWKFYNIERITCQ